MIKRRLFLTLILILQSLYFLSCEQDGMGGVGTCAFKTGENPYIPAGTLIACNTGFTKTDCDGLEAEYKSDPKLILLDLKVTFNQKDRCPTRNLLVSCTHVLYSVTMYTYKPYDDEAKNKKEADDAVAACEKEGWIVQRYIY